MFLGLAVTYLASACGGSDGASTIPLVDDSDTTDSGSDDDGRAPSSADGSSTDGSSTDGSFGDASLVDGSFTDASGDGGDSAPTCAKTFCANDAGAGTCVDTQTDVDNCGGCGKACTETNNECFAGKCRLRSLVPVWAKTIQHSAGKVGDYTGVTGLRVDASNRVVIAGGCWNEYGVCSAGGFDFGGGVKSGDVFVASFDAAGSRLWENTWTSSDREAPNVTTDASGNVFVVTTMKGSMDWGGGTRTAASALVVVSYTSAGAYRWDRIIPYDASAGAGIRVWSIAGGPTDEIVLGGEMLGAIDIGTGTEVGADGFVLALGANGVTRWVKVAQGGYFSNGLVNSVGVDSNGQVTAKIQLGAQTDFGGGLRNPGSLLVAWSASGTWQWDVAVGSPLAIAVDGTDVFTSGSESGLTRRTSASTIVYEAMSLQSTGCGGACESWLLPFAVSPTYDELWYVTSGSFDAQLGRRKKSDGSAATPWAGFGKLETIGGINHATYSGVLRVMPQGDLVATSSTILAGIGGGYTRVGRYQRPM